MSQQSLEAEIARLRAENERLRGEKLALCPTCKARWNRPLAIDRSLIQGMATEIQRLRLTLMRPV